MGKIFGIGLNRTGMKSLEAALRVLGYSVQRFPESWEDIEQATAATDVTVASRFPELDSRYPRSKFIYTVRARESWLASIKRYHASSDMRDALAHRTSFVIEADRACYGTEDPRQLNDEELVRAYAAHDQKVRQFFRDRPADLLVMDIAAGDGWEKLIPFCPMARPFPWEGQAAASP